MYSKLTTVIKVLGKAKNTLKTLQQEGNLVSIKLLGVPQKISSLARGCRPLN